MSDEGTIDKRPNESAGRNVEHSHAHVSANILWILENLGKAGGRFAREMIAPEETIQSSEDGDGSI